MVASLLGIRSGMMVSFVGAGGKSSLMLVLAKELASEGSSVLVTTTTAVSQPTKSCSDYHKIVLGRVPDFMISESSRLILAASQKDEVSGKLKGYSPEYVNYLSEFNAFDYILVEADGAKMRPIKAPTYYEPVIPSMTDIVVGCVGLDSLGKEIVSDNVHRPELLLSLVSGISFNTVKEDHIVSLISSEVGLFKNVDSEMDKVVFLNKADDVFLFEKGIKIAHKIKNECNGIVKSIVACLLDVKRPIKAIV